MTNEGYIDYDQMEDRANVFLPKLIIAGGSAYPRDWDYKRMRQIADKVGAILLADIAHIAGLIAAEEQGNPFEYCDIVTSTTHKSLRGPRAGIIFFRKFKHGAADVETGYGPKIDFSVFPTLQGGPHNHQIAAIAAQFKEVATPQFKEYAQQVKRNAKALAQALVEKGYTIRTGGTDNHLILWDLRPQKINGNKMQLLCDLAGMTLNKNAIFGDTNAIVPGGVRLGSPALTTRGLKEHHFAQVAQFLDEAVKLGQRIQDKSGPLIKNFSALAEQDQDLKDLCARVEAFAMQFGIPGWDVDKMKYQN